MDSSIVLELAKRLDSLTARVELVERNGLVYIPRFEKVEKDMDYHSKFLFGNGKDVGLDELMRDSIRDRGVLHQEIVKLGKEGRSDRRVIVALVALALLTLNPIVAHYVSILLNWTK